LKHGILRTCVGERLRRPLAEIRRRLLNKLEAFLRG
jgi:hypothetical protein